MQKKLLTWGVAVAASAAIVALLASGALAVTIRNYPPDFVEPFCTNWDYEYSSGYNYPVWNRVYRPVPHTYALFYGNGAQYAENRNMNPFWHQQAGGYTTSNGANVDPYDHGGWCTTTFQYGF